MKDEEREKKKQILSYIYIKIEKSRIYKKTFLNKKMKMIKIDGWNETIYYNSSSNISAK